VPPRCGGNQAGRLSRSGARSHLRTDDDDENAHDCGERQSALHGASDGYEIAPSSGYNPVMTPFPFTANRVLAVTGIATIPAVARALAIAPADQATTPARGKELPVRLIPNVPRNAEAYYGPDNFHIIAQTQDPAAQKAAGRDTGAL